jgi:hypothetical protein
MRRTLATLTLTAAFVLGSASTALANPEAPTNGGSANGGGSSGQCTGANADRPAACHNGQGSGN